MGVTTRKTTATEIIAEWIGCDINEVRDMVYQPTRFRTPRVYSWDDEPWSYLCCPTKGQKLPNVGLVHETTTWELAGYSWREAHKDRPIYGVRWTKEG